MTAKIAPTISVVVPTKNRSTLLRRALASIRALEGPDLTLDVIVADNGSTDDTEVVAREFGARFVQTLTPGAAAARNAGLHAATGDYIAFLDDDDAWTLDHLRPQIRMLEERTDLGAAFGQIVGADPTTLQPLAPPYPEQLPADGDCFVAFLREWPQIGALVVRGSVRESVGDLDESLLAAEDWDWQLRLALRHRIGFVPVPSVLFRWRPAGGIGEDDLNRLRVGFTRRTFWKNVRRAGGRRPSAVLLARILLRHDGHYAAYFLRSATAHADNGEWQAARRLLFWAMRTSPLHVGRALIRDRQARHAAGKALRPRLPQRAAEQRPTIKISR